MSRGSVAGIATGYRLDNGGVGVQKLSLLHVVQTGSGAHPAFYPMGTGGPFPGGKVTEREANRSPPTSAEVKKM
jgi:hypothetical protein